MSSFKATLVLDGRKYPLQHCSFNLQQDIQADGSPYSQVRGGQISIVLEDPAPKEIIQWMMKPNEKKSGTINFYEVNNDIGTYQVLKFEEGFCIHFDNTFNGDKNNTGSLISSFTISAKTLSFDGVTLG